MARGRLILEILLGAAALVWLLAAATGRAQEAPPCGPDAPCRIEGGYYLAAPPEDWDGVSPLPVVMYFHGWNSSPEATFRNRAMLRAVHARGALFVAPYAPRGYWRQIGAGRAEAGRDEAAFTRAVIADLDQRYPIDWRRSLASGFSRGASMVWNVACYMGDAFAGYAPIAGGFWDSTPESCPSGPVRLRHIHGTSDAVVAFDQRGIYGSAPIPEGLALYRALGGCAATPDHRYETRRLSCERWSGCGLELCLHSGGHSIPAEWVAEGFDWLLAEIARES